MKIKSVLRQKAEGLRHRGLSYGEIKKEIKVSKSSLSLWLKSIPLKEADRKRLYTKRIIALSTGPNSQKQRRIREVQQIKKTAAEEIKLPLSLDAYKLFGAALYWAEGNKIRNFEITNSDPYLVLFMVKWFKKVFGIEPKNLTPRLNIYPQQNDVKIKKFWSDLTGIPVKRFGKSYIKPLSTNYKKNNLYYGTIKIYVPKGTDMKHRVFGWIEKALQEVSPKVESAQKRWDILRNTERPINLKITKDKIRP